MYSLKINFEQKGLETVTLENVAADQSLLEVLLDAGIELLCSSTAIAILVLLGQILTPLHISRFIKAQQTSIASLQPELLQMCL